MSRHIRPSQGALGSLLALVFTLSTQIVSAAEVELQILHTNDLHSHFRADRLGHGLGGLARIKTAAQKLRRAVPRTLFVDGGDWSEGQIYYNLGSGRETLKLMESMGYDVAVVGNHDWLNGPDLLLDIYRDSTRKMSLVGANLDASRYKRGEEFTQLIPPYVIKEVGGVKVAFIGLITYEYIYQRYLNPIRMLPVFDITRELAARLKSQVDAVVVISHNSVKMNQQLLAQIPELDLVIGAHDHKKLTTPTVVKRSGSSDGWVVEAGAWGKFLGSVTLGVTPRREAEELGKATVRLKSYQLTQMDASIPEDPATLAQIEAVERKIEARYGPVLHDHIADTEVDLDRDNPEPLIGDVVTDAYLAETRADFALDQVSLIYGQLARGKITTADAINTLPAIYNEATDKTWTLRTFPFEGKKILWLMNVLYGSKQLTTQYNAKSALSAAGLEFTYDPIFKTSEQFEPYSTFAFPRPQGPDAISMGGLPVVKDMKIGGRPLDPNRQYVAVASGGILASIEFINSMVPGLIPLNQVKDTGVEAWRALANYLQGASPLTMAKVHLGRMRTNQADLRVYSGDMSWRPLGKRGDGMNAELSILVRNLGAGAVRAGQARVILAINRHGTDETLEPDYQIVGTQTIPELTASGTFRVSATSILPGRLGLYPLTAWIEMGGKRTDPVTHWFKY